jgi:hypothetical protein
MFLDSTRSNANVLKCDVTAAKPSLFICNNNLYDGKRTSERFGVFWIYCET